MTPQHVIQIVFQGVDATGQAVQSALSNIQGAGQKLQEVTGPIANLTESILKFEAGLLATGAAVTLFAIKTAGDFDSAFREITTLIDAPQTAIDDFRAAILDYASTSAKPLEEITGALYGAISAGISYADSVGFVAEAERLAVASKAGLQESLVLLVSSLNAYGAGAANAQKYSDALFTTVKLGQTTLPELASALANVTGIAASAEVPFETLLAAIAALTAAGMPTAQAVTSIKAALSNIIKPSSDAAKLAEELGLQFNTTALSTKGFEGVLAEVYQATGGNVEQMARLFGSTEALNAVLVLTGQGAAAFNSNLQAMQASAGATEAAYEKMAGQVAEGTQKIANAMQVLLIGIGTPLLDEFGGIQQAIAEIFAVIGRSVDKGDLSRFVTEIESLAANVAATLQAIARNLPAALEQADYTGFFAGLDRLKEAVARLFQGVDLTSAEGLAAAITQIGVGFEALSAFTAGAIEGIGPFVKQAIALTDTILKLNPDLLVMAGQLGGVALAVDKLLPAVDTLLLAFLAFGGRGGLLSMVGGGLTAAATALGGFAAAAGAAAGVAGVGLLAYEVTRLSGSYEGLNQLLFNGQNTLGGWLYEVIHGSEAVATAQGKVTTANDEQAAAVRALRQDVEAYLERTQIDAETAEDRAAIHDRLTASFRAQGLVLDEATGKLRSLTEVTAEQAQATQAAEDAARGWKIEIIDGITTYTQVGKAAAGALQPVIDETKKAVEASESFKLKLEELASNERIKLIEAKVKLNVAEVEADTKRIEAAFGSINTTIESTGNLLGDLFSALNQADSRWNRDTIETEIRKESQRRDEALKIQKDLTQAQIDALKARTRAMDRGDALIKVDGAGLQPHLESFMHEILRAIQVKANADGQEFLLGLPS